jgi:hypothetical protein
MRTLLSIIVAFCLIAACPSSYAEERTEDITASVSVSSTFEISADTIPIDFGVMQSGVPVELYPDRYFNEVRCISNNGRTWYLKVFCQDLQGAHEDIESSNLKFRVYWTDGTGSYSSDWMSFGDFPVLVYTSGGIDSTGREVKIQFVYRLEPPGRATAGHYTALVTYTFTESP